MPSRTSTISCTILLAGVVLFAWGISKRGARESEKGETERPGKPLKSIARSPAEISAAVVRRAIASGEPDRAALYEHLPACHNLLTEEEIISALRQYVDPAFLIYEICRERELESRIRILTEFRDIEDQPIWEAVEEATSMLAEIDPERAIAWLDGFSHDFVRGRGLIATFYKIAETQGSERVEEFMRRLTDEQAEAVMSYGEFPELLHLDGLGFARAMEQFESPYLRENLRRLSVVHMIATDSGTEAALAYIAEIPPGERLPNHGRQALIHHLRSENPPLADIVNWAENVLPEGSRSPKHFYEIAQAVADRDRQAVASWIETLDPGTGRDSAILGYVRNIYREEPAYAFEWVTTLTDPNELRQAHNWTITAWIAKDPTAAQAALATAELNAGDRSQLERALAARLAQQSAESGAE